MHGVDAYNQELQILMDNASCIGWDIQEGNNLGALLLCEGDGTTLHLWYLSQYLFDEGSLSLFIKIFLTLT